MCEISEKWFREGEAVGERKGEKKGERKGFLDALFGLVKDGILSITDAAKRADMNVADFEKAYKTFLY